MHLAALFGFSAVCLAALVLHCYRVRGERLALTFFIFTFLAGMRKEVGSFLEDTVSVMDRAPFVHTAGYPLKFCIFNTVAGWMLAFYLAWCVGERIAARVKFLRGRVFPSLLFALLTVAALSYAVEATAVNAGWWQWRFFDSTLSGFLAGKVHLFALIAWFYFAFHFLAPFFLIECSPFRKKWWKYLFLLIPLSRTWTILFLGSYSMVALHDAAVTALFAAALLFYPLKFDLPVKARADAPAWIRRIPMAVMLVVIGFLLFFDIVKLGKPSLTVTLLPLAVLAALAQERIPLKWIALGLAVMAVVAGKTVVAACVAPAALLLLSLGGRESVR